MGLEINTALQIIKVCKTLKINGTVVCLGEPDIGFSISDIINQNKKLNTKIDLTFFSDKQQNKKLNSESFFKALGFNDHYSLDYNNYEGSEIIHDLNSQLDKKYKGIANFVYDGGTLEHVFNIPNALKTIEDLLKIDGVIFHNNPSNGWLDHGFYQFSPTFYHDYYRVNKFKLISNNLNNYLIGLQTYDVSKDLYRKVSPFFGIYNFQRATITFSAQKKEEKTRQIFPTQGYYKEMHNDYSSENYNYLISNTVNHMIILHRILSFTIHIPEILKRLKRRLSN